MNKKIFPILIASIFVLSCGFYFFSKTPPAYLEKALGQVKEKAFQEADKTLDTLERDHPSCPVHLYRGYLAQAKRKFKEAERHFLILSDSLPKELSFAELSFARATNAFFKGMDVEFSEFVKIAKESSDNISKQLFFQGLEYYLHEQYTDALEAWYPLFTSSSFFEGEEWQETILKELFPQEWIELHIAHCLIEEGDIGNAQQILERALHPSLEKDEHSGYIGLSYLFLAFASLKEAHLIPLAERGSEYKLARFYFDRAQLPTAFYREKKRVAAALQEETKSLLQIPELRDWGFSYVHLLEEWNAEGALEDVAETVALAFCRQECADPFFSDLIREEFKNSRFYSLLMDKLAFKTSQYITTAQCETLHLLWETIEHLSLNPKQIASKMSSEVSEEIFRTIHQDTDSLSRTQECLNFWKVLERDPSSRFHFAHSLIGHGEMLWKKEGQEKKGTRLMEIALSLVEENEKVLLLKDVERFLVSLFREAESANMVKRLSLIYDALAFFQLGGQTLASPASLANHLADAEYLFRARHYASAQTHTEWVLKFEPVNQEALRLYGLSSFHLGDYKKASLALKKIPDPDENCRKALILSKAFAAQLQEKHLASRESEEEAL